MQICVISHQRPLNVPKIQAHTCGSEVWFVGKGEGNLYRAAGATNVIESGKLCESRNAALRYAWERNEPCVQLSDDFAGVSKIGTDKRIQKLRLFEALDILLEELENTPFKLAGVPPTANPMNFHPEKLYCTNRFIIGDFFIAKPCDVFFDENMSLKEDYAYTMEHYIKYGGALRVEYLLATFQHRTNHGGAVEARTSQKEQEMIEYLVKKYPNAVTRRKTKPNEVYLKAEKL